MHSGYVNEVLMMKERMKRMMRCIWCYHVNDDDGDEDEDDEEEDHEEDYEDDYDQEEDDDDALHMISAAQWAAIESIWAAKNALTVNRDDDDDRIEWWWWWFEQEKIL